MKVLLGRSLSHDSDPRSDCRVLMLLQHLQANHALLCLTRLWDLTEDQPACCPPTMSRASDGAASLGQTQDLYATGGTCSGGVSGLTLSDSPRVGSRSQLGWRKRLMSIIDQAAWRQTERRRVGGVSPSG
ncbi:unnamed protein product [Pleuronectes platessa]|uniref:Uncharacterized protein n=1 Tax=Pleuronectes platessa TaxID=8262 RepID=A0A9N7YM10_PLEPL|nr:unnamed protein product [Pleuronectes platessa]